MTTSHFDRGEAFTRNIGLVTIEEQERLRDFTIAIPGMGGVGGANLISLVRQGFEKFKIADLDVYELKNFNRQYGARTDTLGKEKVVVMIIRHCFDCPNLQQYFNCVDHYYTRAKINSNYRRGPCFFF